MQEGPVIPEDVARAFGEVLRRVRRNRGLSQEALAHECELDPTYISMLERGVRQPSLTVLVRLAGALATPPSEIVEMVDQRLAED